MVHGGGGREGSGIGLFKCFRSGSWAFATFKYRVKGDTNLCKVFVILKLKTYLISIGGVVVHFVRHY